MPMVHIIMYHMDISWYKNILCKIFRCIYNINYIKLHVSVHNDSMNYHKTVKQSYIICSDCNKVFSSIWQK